MILDRENTQVWRIVMTGDYRHKMQWAMWLPCPTSHFYNWFVPGTHHPCMICVYCPPINIALVFCFHPFSCSSPVFSSHPSYTSVQPFFGSLTWCRRIKTTLKLTWKFDDSALVSYRAISLVSCRAEAILIMSFRRGIPPSLISSGQYLSAAEKRIKMVLVNLHRSGIKGGQEGKEKPVAWEATKLFFCMEPVC